MRSTSRSLCTTKTYGLPVPIPPVMLYGYLYLYRYLPVHRMDYGYGDVSIIIDLIATNIPPEPPQIPGPLHLTVFGTVSTGHPSCTDTASMSRGSRIST